MALFFYSYEIVDIHLAVHNKVLWGIMKQGLERQEPDSHLYTEPVSAKHSVAGVVVVGQGGVVIV